MAAGPAGEMAAGAAGRGWLRASHADRDQVIDALKAAFVQGRLTKDEFDVRVGQALVSRTYAELAAATINIPAKPPAVQLSRKPERGPQPVLQPAPVIMAGTMLTAAMIEAAFLTGNAIVFVAAYLTLITYLIAMFIGGAQMLVTRYERRAARPTAAPGARIPPPLAVRVSGKRANAVSPMSIYQLERVFGRGRGRVSRQVGARYRGLLTAKPELADGYPLVP